MGCNSSAQASEPGSGSASAGAKKGKGVFSTPVEWEYFGMEGRGGPLKQLFVYHGQTENKKGWEPAAWEAEKAAGRGGEFGGGLPAAVITVNGK